MSPPPLWRRLALLLALAVSSGPACVDTEKQTYRFVIKGPREAFMGAASVSLAMGEVEVASTSTMGGAFSLEGKDIDPAQTTSAIFAIRVKDAAGALVAFGQTPELEVRNAATLPLSIFVQRPGTIAPSRSSLRAVRDQISVSGTSVANGEFRLQTTLPVFGLGRERRYDTATGITGDERFSNELYIYNPFTHESEPLATVSSLPRAEMAAVTRADSSAIYVFGGLVREANTERLSSELFIITMARDGLVRYFIAPRAPLTGPPETARRQTVMAAAGRYVLAFGGLGGEPEGPLDSFVLMDPDGQPSTPIVSSVGMPPVPLRMSATRVGHTASTVLIKTRPHVLVFGGAPAGGSVADLVDPTAPSTPVPFSEPPPVAAGRRDHVAVEVTVGDRAEKQVLLIGGLGADGKPRADTLLFDPQGPRFNPGPVTLKTPRSRFAAFVINNDLVVVGGLGADGKPVPTAEIHDTTTWTHVRNIESVPRSGLSAARMSNGSVAIFGGRGDGEEASSSSREIEIYQPRR